MILAYLYICKIKEIAIKISDHTDIKQIDVKKVIQMTLDMIVESLEKGETIELRNFGIFKVKTRKARVGRNPKTGEKIQVGEKTVIKFKPSKTFKEIVKS